MGYQQDLVNKGYYGYAGWNDQAAQADFLATGGAGKGGPTNQPAQNQPSPTTSNTAPVASGQPLSAQDLVSRGYYGYQGWNDAEALADYRATSGAGKGAPTSTGTTSTGQGMTQGMFNQPTINLPELYKNLQEASGIRQLEEQMSLKEKEKTEALGKINDNPFLSEATRVGRAAKLEELYTNRTGNLQKDIERRKADVETQLNLQTKQFDIQSEQAKQALDQFNTLLSSGALDYATGSDIANITRATGLSSSIIDSAIQAKKISGYDTVTQSFDDGSNEGFIIYTIDKQGNVVNQSRKVTGKSSKAQTQYSADPVVSAFIKKYMQTQTSEPKENTTSIQDGWNQTSSGGTSAFRGAYDVGYASGTA